MGAYRKRPDQGADYEGVICGYGAVCGRLAFAFVEDSGRDKGAFDAIAAEKICRLYQTAMQNGAPVIGLFDSAGARVEDGSTVLSAYASVLHAIADASGKIPQIALIGGVCSGLSAVAASMFDLCVGISEKSQFYTVAGKSETAASRYEKGGYALLAQTEDQAFDQVRRLIDWLPQSSRGRRETDDLTAMHVDTAGCTGQSLIDKLADRGESIALYGGCGRELITVLAHIGGRLVGIMGSDPQINGGRLTADGARKAEKLTLFCNSFRIPLVTLADTEGFASANACADAYAAFAKAYACATVPKLAVVVGKAYGGAAALLASHALGADLVFSTEGACIAPMTPQAAVAFLWNDRISDTVSRASLETTWAQTYADAQKAAEKGDVDDLIPHTELRARLASALYMLSAKTDGAPNVR